MSMLVIDPIYK